MVMFPDPAPPLMPVLDAAGLWSPAECRKIEAARERLRRFFPQFHFHVWTVITPEDTKLPAFGFWLLNTCPFYVNETAGDRAWTVLLLLDARTCQAAVIPGYSAERWLSDEDWKKALAVMNKRWKPGKSADAVIRFFDSATALLNQSWKLLGMRRVKRSGS